MLFCDTTAVDGHKSGTGGKLPHVFSSLADFKTHVELNQLVRHTHTQPHTPECM